VTGSTRCERLHPVRRANIFYDIEGDDLYVNIKCDVGYDIVGGGTYNQAPPTNNQGPPTVRRRGRCLGSVWDVASINDCVRE